MASQEQTPEDPKKDHSPQVAGAIALVQDLAQFRCERKPEHLEPWLALGRQARAAGQGCWGRSRR
jgi:hypothetical protein